MVLLLTTMYNFKSTLVLKKCLANFRVYEVYSEGDRSFHSSYCLVPSNLPR